MIEEKYIEPYMSPVNTDVEIWRYVVPPERGEGWGIFLIDSTGMFCAFTDFGNYCYKWTYHGCKDVRSFILEICNPHEYDYVLRKLMGDGKIYDSDATVQHIRQTIREQRRENGLTKEEARTEWERLKEHNDLAFMEDFHNWYGEQQLLSDAYEMVCRRWPSDAMGFCQQLLPRLAQEILKRNPDLRRRREG
jgi:hypothetical protein